MATIERLDTSPRALARAITGPDAIIEMLREGSGLSDGTAIALVREGAGQRILQISPIEYPEVVAESCARATAFAAAIGQALASAVVLPLREGQIDGRSFALLPFHRPFERGRLQWWYQRRRVSPFILDWLAAIAAVHRPMAQGEGRYRADLAALSDLPGIDADIRERAAAAIALVDRVGAIPHAIPMHGDLWLGNILTAPIDATLPFTVIDWRGSRVDGYPIFDLVRLASSYRLSPGRLNTELRRHGDAFGCSIEGTEVHLLAALGHYARHLGEMPIPAFLAMSRACVDLHRRAR